MTLTCNTIQDLLPLVVEDLASEDTKKIVQAHIEDCPECRKEYEELKTAKLDYRSENELESIPFKKTSKKLKKINFYTGLMAAIIISLLLIIGVNLVTKPIPLTYDQAVKSIEKEGNRLYIKFKPEVTNYNIERTNHDEIKYKIMAWKNKISRLIKVGEAKTTVINLDQEENVLVSFVNQDVELDKIIYGREDEGGSLTLPRLAMNYYLTLMTIIFLISGIFVLLLKKMPKIHRIVKIITIFSFSYILSHFLIVGPGGATHYLIRDLSFVVITTILTFSLFMLLIYKNTFIKSEGKT